MNASAYNEPNTRIAVLSRRESLPGRAILVLRIIRRLNCQNLRDDLLFIYDQRYGEAEACSGSLLLLDPDPTIH